MGLALYSEARLLFIVVFAGALGSVLHALRSLFWYVGNRELRWSWALMYLLLPWAGAIVALMFYFVLRAGLLTAQAPAGSTNAFGIAAVAGLVGLFSQQAVLKLKDVFDTLFRTPPPGQDAVPQDGEAAGARPRLASLSPASPGSSPKAQTMTVRGAGFQPPLSLKLTPPGGVVATIASTDVKNASPSSFEVDLTIDVPGDWTIIVVNADGRESEAFKFKAT